IMDKTISITIAGLILHVEESAYRELEIWLSSVRSHFGQYDDSDEILRDIENRLAELLSELTGNRKRAVTTDDVRDVISQIGTTEDFEEFDGETESDVPRNRPVKKRLYRDPDNSLLGGVASGLAAYLGIDITLARVLFVFFTLIWGTSLLLYIVLWIAMPVADTTAKKLEMKGEPLTLARMEARIKETLPPGSEMSTRLGRFFERFFSVLREAGEAVIKFLRSAGPLLLLVTGWVLIIIGSVDVIFGTTLYLIGLTDSTTAMFEVSLLEMASSPWIHYILLTLGWLLVVIPGLLVAMAGRALAGFKPARYAPSPVVLLSIWVIALMIAIIVGLREIPVYEENIDATRSGVVEVQFSEIIVPIHLHSIGDNS
ncbi:MAG: PspC domain-containing protein, partial [Bacteroidota bacterium]